MSAFQMSWVLPGGRVGEGTGQIPSYGRNLETMEHVQACTGPETGKICSAGQQSTMKVTVTTSSASTEVACGFSPSTVHASVSPSNSTS